MKKQIANVLSSIRILTAVALLFFRRLDGTYLTLYCLCGVTDLLDGPIARATGSQSALGAKLDTAGDVLTYTALGRILFLERRISARTILRFLLPLSGMFAAGVIARFRFGVFVFAHTALAKVFGVGCFFLPFFCFAGSAPWYLTALWLIAVLTAAEMIAIQLCINHPDPDILSLAWVKRANERFDAASEESRHLTA